MADIGRLLKDSRVPRMELEGTLTNSAVIPEMQGQRTARLGTMYLPQES